MAMAKADLINTITNVLVLSVNQCEVLSNDGCYTISTVIYCKYEEIHECCTTKFKLKTTIGGASYGDRKTKCLQALAWWSINLTLRCKQIFLSDFDGTIMSDFIDEYRLD